MFSYRIAITAIFPADQYRLVVSNEDLANDRINLTPFPPQYFFRDLQESPEFDKILTTSSTQRLLNWSPYIIETYNEEIICIIVHS